MMFTFIFIGIVVIILSILFIHNFSKRNRRNAQSRDQQATELNNTLSDTVNNNNTIVLLNQIINPSNGTESKAKGWNFEVTVNLVDRILSYEDNKLYFDQLSTIQTKNYFNVIAKPGYFEIEILKLEGLCDLLKIGLGPLTDDLDQVKASSIYLDCINNEVILYGNKVNWLNLGSINVGDIIGFLYSPNAINQITLTVNGNEIGVLNYSIGSNPIFPTIKCNKGGFVQFNFGNIPFKYPNANKYQYNLIPIASISEPPPSYS